MAGEQLLLDPTSEGTGTQLDITDNTLGYYLLSHEYPDPEPDVVMTGSIDTEGELPAAGKHKPRTITITVRCVQPSGGAPSIGTMVSNLQRKIGKLYREGGTLRRVLPSGDTITFDILQFGARINVPADKRWGARSAADATITLTCAPYGRGASIALSASAAATTKAPLVFTKTGIKGDMPATGTLRIDNVTNAKTFASWGLQSRRYSAASTAALFFEAEDGQPSAASANAGPAGASGGGANKTMRHTVGTAEATSYTIATAGTVLSHIGTFRVYARVQAATTNTGTVSVRLEWSPSYPGGSIRNDLVAIETSEGVAIEGSWVLLDLGLVTIPVTRLGNQQWSAVLNAKATDAGNQLDYDWVALVPCDEGMGIVKEVDSIPANGAIDISSQDVLLTNNKTSAVDWFRPRSYEGAYLRVPPEGAEARTLRIIVILAGAASGNLTDTLVDAPNLDAITATLTYTPRYLAVPAP
jgi:hypothetical protein